MGGLGSPFFEALFLITPLSGCSVIAISGPFAFYVPRDPVLECLLACTCVVLL